MVPIHKAPCLLEGTSVLSALQERLPLHAGVWADRWMDVPAVPLAVCVNVQYRWDLLSLGKSCTRNLGFVVAVDYMRRIWPCLCRSTGELHAVAVPFNFCV